AVHHDQSFDRLHLLDRCPEPAAGDADVADVLSAELAVVRLPVSISRHAGVGAIYRRGTATDPLYAYCPRHHAERRQPAEPAIRHDRAGSVDVAGDDDRGFALPPHAGLMLTARVANRPVAPPGCRSLPRRAPRCF